MERGLGIVNGDGGSGRGGVGLQVKDGNGAVIEGVWMLCRDGDWR